ncbi:DNA starvation/stationary phase protection protein [Marispirochaeta aestuarii]|uniref:Dps family protein n=1 Tax=Marispirochaeta aestuarii TaxID=1963862 RepID=UPI002ABE4445|nr:DNA starvation/stationary phase protection protein [Marispirochaeta aestuarii]
MTKIEKMAQLVADLNVLNTKFHNLHWNVTGPNFQQLHLLTEASYNDFLEKYDELTERMKMLGKLPPASVKKYLELTKVQELADKEYSAVEVLKNVLEAYKFLKEEFTELRSLADAEGDFVTLALAEGYIGEFDKQIWFVSSMQR